VDLGSPHAPSFERLAEARAALVVGDRAMHAALAPRLEATGVQVLLLEVDSVPATLASVGVLGRAVGAGPELEQAASGVRAELAGLRLAQPVPTLPLFGTPASFLVITGRTWLGSLLDEINLANVAGGLSGAERVPGYAAVSDEVMSTLRPKLVLVVAHGDASTIERTLRARMDDGGPWAAFDRTAHDGVHVLDPTVFGSNPGLALPIAARRLRALAGAGSGV
jgi:iron complex transport system substrate-binding protein